MGGPLHADSQLYRSARPTPPQKEAIQLGLEAYFGGLLS